MPQVLLFQFVLTADCAARGPALIWQLVSSGLRLLQHPDQFDPDTLRKVVASIISSSWSSTSASAAIALAMERREKWRLAPWLMLQRFGYRQLMY